MRKIYLILIPIFLFVSCQNDKVDSSQIFGTWHLRNVETNQQVQNIKDYQKAIKQLIKSTTIQFNNDNTFRGTIWGDTTFGYWSIVDKTLTIKDLSNKRDFSVKIKKLSNGKLILEENSDSIVQVLTFTY